MTQPLRIAFIGNSLPRRCGIATFTTDLQEAVSASHPRVEATIVAMNDRDRSYAYPPTVRVQIQDDRVEDYVTAADDLNMRRLDAVCLQHEFGIFGGEAGANVLALLSRLNAPIVTTLHTVLADPSPVQRRVFCDIVAVSAKVVVMAEKGRELLRSIYAVPAEKIEVVPHGIPDTPYADPSAAKSRLGFEGKPTILTFGLLSPNKGIEVMIDAMPEILRNKPDAVYVVLGATHPNLVRDQGETYRDSLVARVRERGVEAHVVFLDRFVDKPTLLDFIAMCDVYVTPYLNESQMTSGTLAYSFGMGKAVVSTPYWHAQELLADDRGVLVPFNDVAATAREISGLLTDDLRRERLRKRAYASSRSMTWERTASRYAAVFESVRRTAVTGLEAVRQDATPQATTLPPRVKLDHFELMCDDTGLLQHAVHSIPDRHARLLRRRQCARAAGFELAEFAGRAADGRSVLRAVRGIRPARVECGSQAVPEFHELRPALARGRRLRRQSWPIALGARRVLARRFESVAPAMGERAVSRSAAFRRSLRIAARLGLRAARHRRLPQTRHHESLSIGSCASGSRTDWFRAWHPPRRPTGCGSRRASPTRTPGCRRRCCSPASPRASPRGWRQGCARCAGS